MFVIGLLSMVFSIFNVGNIDCAENSEKNQVAVSGIAGSGACPVGTWKMQTCNEKEGKFLIYYFGADGSGYSENPDCYDFCTPLRYHFKYSIKGDKITYNFTSTSDVTCRGKNQGGPKTPEGTHTIIFTCLNGGTQLKTETVNIQTGVRSIATFNRM